MAKSLRCRIGLHREIRISHTPIRGDGENIDGRCPKCGKAFHWYRSHRWGQMVKRG